MTVPIRSLDDAGLMQLSKSGQLSLSLAEMKTIQGHFRDLGRDPTDVELETIAQTWSEHCSHKTLKGTIDFTMTDAAGTTTTERIDNLLKATIFGATQELRKSFGADDWCVSVFVDNAGIVRFDETNNVCFKVETHNRPSAIEPYGGSNTGIGGVIRDVLGTGLGARPVCNTDVFCFAPPTTPPESLPPGVLHPKKVMQGVVSGVRDYGNRMGIPTINGAVCFDPRYLGNPLVYCGTVGVIPIDKSTKSVELIRLVVALGGRTGRDGIHGATFSSAELDSESEKISGGAVQIGNAIAEKKLADVLLAARDRGLYRAVTDCGAGGFSSAVGEMGEKIGAVVHLDRAPLKYLGLTYTETWISEAQERMVLAVPPDSWSALSTLCKSEDVEATVLGTFEPTGRLELLYKGKPVAALDMHFLHDGRPDVVRKATWSRMQPARRGQAPQLVKRRLPSRSCSRSSEAGTSARKSGSSASTITRCRPAASSSRSSASGTTVPAMPRWWRRCLRSWAGLAIGCGINPHLGDLDPYRMAALAIDEAVRNVVAVGADPSRIALLDNFCWGNTERPEVLGSLVRAAQACRDVSLAYRMPFISGKDSLNNEFRHAGETIVIPPTLLISAMGRVGDVRRCVTMDLKEPGNVLFLVGTTGPELGGSHYNLVTGQTGGVIPAARSPSSRQRSSRRCMRRSRAASCGVVDDLQRRGPRRRPRGDGVRRRDRGRRHRSRRLARRRRDAVRRIADAVRARSPRREGRRTQADVRRPAARRNRQDREGEAASHRGAERRVALVDAARQAERGMAEAAPRPLIVGERSSPLPPPAMTANIPGQRRRGEWVRVRGACDRERTRSTTR